MGECIAPAFVHCVPRHLNSLMPRRTERPRPWKPPGARSRNCSKDLRRAGIYLGTTIKSSSISVLIVGASLARTSGRSVAAASGPASGAAPRAATRSRSAALIRSSSVPLAPAARKSSTGSGEPKVTVTGWTLGMRRPRGSPLKYRGGMVCIDREDLHCPAQQRIDRVGEQSNRVARSIKAPEPRPRQRCGDRQPIEIADVIGSDHERSRVRQLCSAGDAQPEHDHPVEGVQRQSKHSQHRARRSKPALQIDRRRRSSGGAAGAPLPRSIASCSNSRIVRMPAMSVSERWMSGRSSNAIEISIQPNKSTFRSSDRHRSRVLLRGSARGAGPRPLPRSGRAAAPCLPGSAHEWPAAGVSQVINRHDHTADRQDGKGSNDPDWRIGRPQGNPVTPADADIPQSAGEGKHLVGEGGVIPCLGSSLAKMRGPPVVGLAPSARSVSRRYVSEQSRKAQSPIRSEVNGKAALPPNHVPINAIETETFGMVTCQGNLRRCTALKLTLDMHDLTDTLHVWVLSLSDVVRVEFPFTLSLSEDRPGSVLFRNSQYEAS